MPTANEVDKVPGPGWSPGGAFDLPGIWATVEKHRPTDLPISTAMFVTICYEETACCNMVQNTSPVAIGPGQFQASEDIGVRFFASDDNGMGSQMDSSMMLMAVRKDNTVYWRTKRAHPELPLLTRERILGDNDFSIKMHLKYFQWLHLGKANGQAKGRQGILAAQTGNNSIAIQAFADGATELSKMLRPDPAIRQDWSKEQWQAYLPKRRAAFAFALNTARRGFHGNPIKYDDFTKFFEFFLPDKFLMEKAGYMGTGF